MNALRDVFLAIAFGGLMLIGATLFLIFIVGVCIGVYQLFAWVLA